MVLGLYSLGFAVAIGIVTYVGHLLQVPAYWMVICAVVLLGAVVLTSLSAGDPPNFPDEDCYR